MANPLLAPAIGAVGSAVSSLIGNEGSRKAQARANRYNIEMWERQNAYNDPQAQMERLKNAGLNPNLIYGTSPSSAVGNAESIAPAKAAEYKFDNPLKDINTFANLKQTEQQIDNLKADNTLKVQEAAHLAIMNPMIQDSKSRGIIQQDADLWKTQSVTRGLNIDNQLRSALMNNSMDMANEALRQQKVKTIGMQLDNTFKDKTMKDRVLNVMYGVENAKQSLTGQELRNELMRYEKELNSYFVNKADPAYIRILGLISGALGKKTSNYLNSK